VRGSAWLAVSSTSHNRTPASKAAPAHDGADWPPRPVVRVGFRNGRYVYLTDLVEADDTWLQGVNVKGRSVLVRRDLVRQTVPAR
jgi:hypothetical protein